MEPVSFVFGLSPLVQLAVAVKDHIQHLRHNDTLKKGLVERADVLIHAFPSAPESTQDESIRLLYGTILNDLRAVENSLQSLNPSQTRSRCFDWFISCIKATHNHKKLQHCQTELDRLINLVMDLRQEWNRIRDKPTIVNDTPEPPISDVGLNRASCVLRFLQTSASQELRVVCIHGLPGLGKTTLLYEVMRADSKEVPFLARAFVQIGHEVTDEKICSLQSKILQQLNWPNKEFPSTDFGRGELIKCFEQHRKEEKPLLLAIDNVFSPNDLDKLLPTTASLTSLLPRKSCVVLTCRDYGVVQSFLINCSLREDNKQQVLCYNPPFLSDEEGMGVFVSCARMQQDDHLEENQELLRALVPKFKGLPLALTVLGNIFKDPRMRTRGKWQEIEEQMTTLEDDGGFTARITAALCCSYKLFSKPLQKAFLGVVEVFYGWPWELVECMVGESSMGLLKDSSFISPVGSLKDCNLGAISEGFMQPFEQDSFMCSNRVWMHDVVFTFGKNILDNSTNFAKNRSSIRSFNLTTDDPDITELRSHLADARNLQILEVTPSRVHGFKVSYCEKAFQLKEGDGKVKILMLDGLNNLANSIIQTMVTDGIRAMHLKDCQAIYWLPDTFPLKELQALQVQSCNAFQGFSNTCVQGWHNLQRLIIMSCPALTTIPDALASLPSLQLVHIDHCPHLQEFPPLSGPHGPFQLVLNDCPVLERMGDVSCRLETMRLTFCTLLQKLPCFDSHCLETLTTLIVISLPQLQQLPASICSMKALRELNLTECESLIDLPHNVGDLACLERFYLWQCKKLQQLPASVCSMKALRELLVGCDSLIDLPHNVGDLACLEEFALFGCEKLQQVPASICSMKALRKLLLVGCESLIDVPHNVGDLACLESFGLCECPKLQQLPASICSMKALRELGLGGSESLIHLPHNVGDLACLEKFDLSGCKKLQQLPASICNMKALRELNLTNCVSLLDLPDNIRDLACLEKLTMEGCKKLQQVPGSVYRMKALEHLDLRGCESLADVPHNIGDMPHLTIVH